MGTTNNPIVYVGYRLDGAYVVVTRDTEEQYAVHIGSKDAPMTTIEVKEVRPSASRPWLIPTLVTERGEFIQNPEFSLWGSVELCKLNPRDYHLEVKEKDIYLRWS